MHKIPKDLKNFIFSNTRSKVTWEDITPLARNEWICWVVSVKKAQTRAHHIKRAVNDLAKGKRRPCCWAGCPHR